MKRISIFLLSIFLFSLSSTLAQRANRGFRNDCIRESNLNLTDEQKEKFNELRLAHREYVIDLQAQLEKNKIKMQKLITDDNLDKASVMSLVDKNSEIKSKIQKSKVEMLLGMRELLTDEQKEKFGNRLFNYCEIGSKREFDRKPFRKFKRF